MAGGLAGVFVEGIGARDGRSEARLMAGIGAAGLALAAGGYAASFLPAIYANSTFWTSSPTFFFLRIGVLLAVIPLAWWWRQPHAWRGTILRESPLEVFGRSSLFVYWIHVEMVYGFVSRPLHRVLPLAGSLLACVVFSAFLYGLVLLKNRFLTRARPTPDRLPERAVQT
jgi:hypothetical protein